MEQVAMNMEFERFSLTNSDEETLDSILGNRIKVLQNRKGYRFAIDSVLLARFVAPHISQAEVVELGAGNGVVSLMMAILGKPQHIQALELQPSLLSLARRNVALNGLDPIITIQEHDIRRIPMELPSRSCDWVVANPPYYEIAKGRVSPDSERALARHELTCTMDNVLAAMNHLVRRDGRIAMVHRAGRVGEIFTTLHKYEMEVTRLRMVHPDQQSPGELVLIEAGRRIGRTGYRQVVHPPLFLHGKDGEYTEEARTILWGEDLP